MWATIASSSSRASSSPAWFSRWSRDSTSTPSVETVTYYLREYSEQEMWERRDRLGMAAAKVLEEDEKAKAETIDPSRPSGVRGIGVRIEDDILITADGCEILTAGTPKTVDEVERACREASRLPRSWA